MPRTLAEHADRLNLRAGQAGRLPPLILVSDTRRLADPRCALGHLRAGDAVLFRHYDGRDRAAHAATLARECKARGLLLIVAADAALAHAVGAAGVHLPERLVHRARAARAVRGGFLVTVAAHGRAGIVAAARAGADAALLSPVFATASHPGAPALGVTRFAALVRGCAVPVYALGGVTAENAGALAQTGAAGIAALGAFLDQDSSPAPQDEARD